MEKEGRPVLGDYIIVKAEENGVTIIGLTRGQNTKFHHTEKLDRGEVMLAQFTEHTSAIKIRGKAKIFTKHGNLESGE
ncbi:MAG TPA: trp RNA-binding attenuation protein MtrB [Clostridia bacterium]|jgi:transcription attenuation protein (tryptophan RNA-binding attenuator protein)|nr:trp RNA-binding attenuation protein MtrB [Clostridia bacterium]HHY06552.1 trp RNA-binding attenuation protein MtrB [Clostridia bacterium]